MAIIPSMREYIAQQKAAAEKLAAETAKNKSSGSYQKNPYGIYPANIDKNRLIANFEKMLTPVLPSQANKVPVTPAPTPVAPAAPAEADAGGGFTAGATMRQSVGVSEQESFEPALDPSYQNSSKPPSDTLNTARKNFSKSKRYPKRGY